MPAVPENRRILLSRPRLADLAVFVGFLAGGLWVTARFWLDLDHRFTGLFRFDESFFEWTMANGLHFVRHPGFPFLTRQMNLPAGVNLMANNTEYGLTIPLAPVTLLFGAHVSYVVAVTGTLTATAYGWYHVLSRHVVSSRVAAFLGGAVCGFGPGFAWHAGGQLNVIANFLVPFIVWRTIRLAEPGRALRNGVVLGLLVVWQAFIAEESLFIAALTVGLFLCVYAALRPVQARREAPAFLRGLGVAGLVAGALLAYPLAYQLFGPMHYRGIMTSAAAAGAPLDAYLRLQPSSIGSDPLLTGAFPHNYAEQNAFISWPLVVATVVIGWWLWREVRVRALVLTTAILAILALGPALRLNETDTGVWLPYRALAGLPAFDSLVPSRLELGGLVLAGIVVAIGWDRLAAQGGGTARLARALLVVLLVPIVPQPTPAVGARPVPAFITSGEWRRYVPVDRTLVSVPVPTMGRPDGMLWSAHENLDFAIPAGYFFAPTSDTDRRASYGPPVRFTTALLEKVADTGTVPAVTGEDRQRVLADLRYWRAAVVVLALTQERADQLRETVEAVLGPPLEVGGAYVWDVRYSVP
jgi:hypothetical protein